MKLEKLQKKQPFRDKTVMICGGSKGMGLSTAKLVAQLGGNLCLIARNMDVLKQAQQECMADRSSESQFVEIISCDTTDEVKIRPLIEKFIDQHGIPHYLLNMVGYAHPGYVQDLKLEDYRRNMEVNYFGQLIPMHIILPHFLERGSGYFANVASLASIVGIIGYSAYTPTKHAVVGLVEGMWNELSPKNIGFSILYPPDTDTPGFATENLTKPAECVEMSKTGKIMTPEAVALVFVSGIVRKKFAIYPGEAAWMQFVKRLMPGLTRKLIAMILRSAQKQIKKNEKK
ncbi:MAG: SDR family oxidoreductase [Promethearchaeota archaeon]